MRLFLIPVLLLAVISPAIANDKSRPNILFIIADDMAHADLSCAGHPLLKTPNLDRIAKKGVRFTHAFTPNPICTPSRAALLTGQDCWTNGCYFFGMKINPKSPHFAKLLSDAGYETFYSGKWHNDDWPAHRGFTSGSCIIRGGCPVSRGGHEKPVIHDNDGKNKTQIEKFSSTLISDHAMKKLDAWKPGEKPLLMVVSYAAPHDPWTPPGKYAAMYPKEKIPLPPNFMPRPKFRWFTEWHGTKLRDEALMPFPRTPEGVRDVRSRYFGMVTQMDYQIGRVLDKLEEKKMAQNTMIIFVADHGISLGSHGFSGKQTMYEEGIRLPMLVYHPQLKRAGKTNANLVSLIDLLPTMCAAAKVTIPDSVEGQSLLGFYQGDNSKARTEIYSAFHSPERHRMVSRMVRESRYKLIHNRLTDEEELYDLEKDPRELKNLATDKAHVEARDRLRKKLLDWRSKLEPREILKKY